MRTRVTILVLAALASSCGTPQAYATADKLTYGAIAPEYRAYVLADPALTQDQKDRRLRSLTTWRKRFESALASPPQ